MLNPLGRHAGRASCRAYSGRPLDRATSVAERRLLRGMVGGWNISAAAVPGGVAIARVSVSRV
eukprot:4620979-Pleurochrysis_carterae.AAC.1